MVLSIIVHRITPSPSKNVAKGTLSDLKRGLEEDDFLETDSVTEDEENMRKQRRKLFRDKRLNPSKSVPLSHSKHSAHNESLLKSVEFKQDNKKERTRVSVPNDKKKEHMPPVSSIMVRENFIDDSSQIVFSSLAVRDVLCLFCKNKTELCHERTYSQYCLQAARNYLHNNDDGWLEGFSPARMERVFVVAYNGIRRADVFQKFGYYSPETFSVPKCMELGSMHDAVDLGFKNEVDKNSK